MTGDTQSHCHCQVNFGSNAEEEDEDNSKCKRGSFYMVVKDLMKSSPATEISITGYKVASKGDAALGEHGYDLTAEEGKPWVFVPKDKDPKSFSSGNAFRPLAQQLKPLHPNFTWMWRCQWHPVHAKLSLKKPFVTVNRDLKLESNKPIKLVKEE